MNSQSDDFCRYFVGLPLTRNDYIVRREARIADETVDLQVERFKNGAFERFLVVIKGTEGVPGEHKEGRIETVRLKRKFGLTVYLAVVNYDGEGMAIDEALQLKMIYSENELSITTLKRDKPEPQYEPV